MSPTRLKILSYNIHKGFNAANERFILKDIKESIRALNADLVFLQEVIGHHEEHAATIEEWPTQSQFEYLADEIWPHYAYGKNSVYSAGHHGNAILSAFPITHWSNADISTNEFESRGLLHAVVTLPETENSIHCFCSHLSLFQRGREKQVIAIADSISRETTNNEPFILAGDFNDWRHRASDPLCQLTGATEAFADRHGFHARSYPAFLPILRLDRIYVRGVKVLEAKTLKGATWRKLSDHLALFTEVEINQYRS